MNIRLKSALAAWLVASPLAAAPPGEWEPIPPAQQDWEVKAVHMIHLHTGKILVWGEGSQSGTTAKLFNPADGSLASANVPAPWDLFCAGHAQIGDGSILIAGGGFHENKAPLHSLRLNPTGTPTWEQLDDMVFRRWYPTCTTLPSGDVSTFSGWAQSAPEALVINHHEFFDKSSSRWIAKPTAERWVDLYPYMFVMPDGRLFHAGPHRQTAYLADNWIWAPAIDAGLSVHHASAVMFDAVSGKILRTGGAYADTDPPTNEATDEAQVFDHSAASPGWVTVAPMNMRRVNHNLVVLPDGKVLAAGGARYIWADPQDPNLPDSREPVMRAEIYDPASNTWSIDPTGVEMARPRWYHSSATLLADGRVLVAGGDDMEGWQNSNGQIYRPPYLDGDPARPKITSAPAAMAYNTLYNIEYTYQATAAAITGATLTRLGSCTHGFDSDQRFVPLEYTVNGSVVQIKSPATNKVAPPGYYMLWILGQDGVPCEKAAYVRLPN